MKQSKSITLLKPIMVSLWACLFFLTFSVLILAPSNLAGSASTGDYNWSHLSRFTINSIYTSSLAALVSVVWSFLPALTAARRENRLGKTALSVIACLPLFIAPAVIAVVSVHLFGARGSITNLAYQLLESIAPSKEPALRLAPVFTLTGTAMVLATAFYPVSYLVNLAILQRINRSVEEAGLMETSLRKMYFHLLLPMIRGGLFAGGILVFLLAINEFSIPESLRAQPVLVSRVYTLFGVFYDGRAASFAALLLIGCSFLLIMVLSRLLRSSSFDEAVESTSPNPKNFPLVLRILGWIMAILPGAIILGVLLTTVHGPEGIFHILSHVWSQYHPEFFQSVKLAILTTLICLITGWTWGNICMNDKSPWKIRFLLLVGFVLPGPIIALAFKMVMLLPPGWGPALVENSLVWLDGTIVPLLLAHTIRFTPIVALLVEFQLRRAPKEFTQGVLMESQGLLSQLFTWKFHLAIPALIAGSVAVFALSLSEVGATVLLIPPGETTLSVSLMTLMHYAPTSHVSALCLMLTLPSLIVLTTIFFPLMLLMLGKRR